VVKEYIAAKIFAINYDKPSNQQNCLTIPLFGVAKHTDAILMNPDIQPYPSAT